MAKSKETFGKKEKEKQRFKQRQEKKQKMEERKANKKDGNSLESMMAYVDETGNLTDIPQDPTRKKVYKLEDIQIGVPEQDHSADNTFRTGTVSFFNKEKGFGFIIDATTNERLFFHVNDLTEAIDEADKVKYMAERGPRGMNAVQVSKA
jgi:cold shock CspA family protein